jgi:Holliday junction DNA helicase RuvA
MIGKIRGKLVEIENNIGLIETESGVFYQVHLSPRLIKSFPLNSLVKIYTYLEVKENALNLYGFTTKEEYQIFKNLLTVSGVGAKTAFSVISFLTIQEIINAISQNNIDALAIVPRLGKKTAAKIILELSQKLKKEFTFSNLYLSEDDKMIIDTLVALGYKTQEAKNIFVKIPKNLSFEEKIKWALKNK